MIKNLKRRQIDIDEFDNVPEEQDLSLSFIIHINRCMHVYGYG